MGDPIAFHTAPRPRLDLLDPRGREHVWIATAVYRIQPEAVRAAIANNESLHLDRENLATIEVGCWVCEQPFSERLSHRKCTGEPR